MGYKVSQRAEYITTHAKISSIANKTLDQKKFEKVNLLPITDDLLKVREFLVKEISLLTKRLHEKQEIETWKTLAEYAGTRITMFHRRRISEVFGMLVTRFIERGKYKDGEILEVKESMTMFEKHLIDRYGT